MGTLGGAPVKLAMNTSQVWDTLSSKMLHTTGIPEDCGCLYPGKGNSHPYFNPMVGFLLDDDQAYKKYETVKLTKPTKRTKKWGETVGLPGYVYMDVSKTMVPPNHPF